MGVVMHRWAPLARRPPRSPPAARKHGARNLGRSEQAASDGARRSAASPLAARVMLVTRVLLTCSGPAASGHYASPSLTLTLNHTNPHYPAPSPSPSPSPSLARRAHGHAQALAAAMCSSRSSLDLRRPC